MLNRARARLANWIEPPLKSGIVSHIQLNVVDSELLRDAQETPECYTDLQICLTSYGSFWIDLPKQTQDTIIAHYEHSFEGH